MRDDRRQTHHTRTHGQKKMHLPHQPVLANSLHPAPPPKTPWARPRCSPIGQAPPNPHPKNDQLKPFKTRPRCAHGVPFATYLCFILHWLESLSFHPMRPRLDSIFPPSSLPISTHTWVLTTTSQTTRTLYAQRLCYDATTNDPERGVLSANEVSQYTATRMYDVIPRPHPPPPEIHNNKTL